MSNYIAYIFFVQKLENIKKVDEREKKAQNSIFSERPLPTPGCIPF